MYFTSPLLATVALALMANTSYAHVVLQDPLAAAGAGYRATLQVGHGCDGAATTAITVRIPDGFAGAKPMPKPGWTLSVRSAALATPYVSHGKTISEDVVEVRWVANGPDNALPDAWYDEFVLRGTAPAQPGLLWFKVRQSCGSSELDWAQVPPNGSATRGLKAPAALLEVIDTGNGGGHQH